MVFVNMKKMTLLLGLLFVSGCSEQVSDQNELDHKIETGGENDTCTELEVGSSKTWAAGKDYFAFAEYNGTPVLIKNNEIAQIMGDKLLWVYSEEHEGYSQYYRVKCDCESCTFSFSDYAESPTEHYIISYTAHASSNEVVMPQPIVATLTPDLAIQGKYYASASDFKNASMEISPTSILLHFEDGAFVVVQIVEKLSDSEYLVHHVDSEGTTLPFADKSGNWFSVFKIEPDGAPAVCPVCGTEHDQYYNWSLSSYWGRYRTLTKDKKVFEKVNSVHKINFDECTLDALAPMASLAGSWISDKGNWKIDYDERSQTPYDDDRTLQYLETTSINNGVYRMLFTYGTMQSINHADPNRFSNVIVYTIEAEKDKDCINVKSNLSSNGIWANEDVAILSDSDRLCPDSNHYSGSIKSKNSLGDTIDIESGVLTLKIASSGEQLIAEIIDYNRTTISENMYYDDILISIRENTTFSVFSECNGKYSMIRLYYYLNGSAQDSRPYFNYMYPKTAACSEDQMDESIHGQSFSVSIKGFYY